jgi:hypothetical protein
MSVGGAQESRKQKLENAQCKLAKIGYLELFKAAVTEQLFFIFRAKSRES